MPGQHRDHADPPFRAAARVLVGHLLACWDALCGLWRPRRRWPSSSGRRDVQAAVALVVGAVLAAGLSLLFTVGTAPAAAPAPVPRPRPTVTVNYPLWKLPPGWPADVPGARPRVSGSGG